MDNYLRQVNILLLANQIQSNEKELQGQVLSEILHLYSRVVIAITNTDDYDEKA